MDLIQLCQNTQFQNPPKEWTRKWTLAAGSHDMYVANMTCAQAPIKLCVPTKAPALDHDLRLDALKALMSPAVRIEIGSSIVTTSIWACKQRKASEGGNNEVLQVSYCILAGQAGAGLMVSQIQR